VTSRLFPIVLLLVLLGGCGQPKIKPVSLSPEDERKLAGELAALDAVLRQHTPQVAAKLNPPAAPADIARLRTELAGAIIQPLEAWFQWHNGAARQPGPVVLIPLGRPVDLRAALAERNLIRQIPLVPTRRKLALKILDDDAGDGFFVDLVGGQARVFYHMLEDPDSYQDYGRLEEFVGFIRSVHEAQILAIAKEGPDEFDLQKYQMLEAAYFGRKSQP
jgi:hypothetical protein